MIELFHKLAVSYYLLVILIYLSMAAFHGLTGEEIKQRYVSVFGYMLAAVPFLVLLQGIFLIWWF